MTIGPFAPPKRFAIVALVERTSGEEWRLQHLGEGCKPAPHSYPSNYRDSFGNTSRAPRLAKHPDYAQVLSAGALMARTAIWNFQLLWRTLLLEMRTATDRQDALRFWGLGTFAILLSASAALSYLHSMGYGIAAGDLIGLRGREADVAFAQRWATLWLMASVCCLGVSSLAGALAMPIYEEAGRLSRLIARLVVASIVSFVLAVLISFASISIITSSHHSVVR